MTPRGQFSVSVPYYHVTDPSGLTAHGFGATYLTGKFALAQDGRVHVAVITDARGSELDSGGSRRAPRQCRAASQRAVRYRRRSGVRIDRIFFARIRVRRRRRGMERRVARTLVASLSHSYSVKSDPLSDALGVSRHRTDASGSLYVREGSAVVFFASVGHALAPVTETERPSVINWWRDDQCGGTIGTRAACSVAGNPRLPNPKPQTPTLGVGIWDFGFRDFLRRSPRKPSCALRFCPLDGRL